MNVVQICEKPKKHEVCRILISRMRTKEKKIYDNSYTTHIIIVIGASAAHLNNTMMI